MITLLKIISTSAATIIGGVMIFVGGQITVKFIIEPIQALRKTLSAIQYAIFFYQSSYITPGGKKDLEEQAYEEFKKLSSELCSNVNSIPFYKLLSYIFKQFLPSMENILKAITELRSLSNSVQSEDRSSNIVKANKTCNLLNLQKLE